MADHSPSDRLLETALQKLRTDLDGLQLSLRAMTLRWDHYMADLALYGYGVNVLEQSAGVRHLLEGGWAGAAYPPARAAIEACQDALLLLAWIDYDDAGAKANAYNRLEFFQVRMGFVRTGLWEEVPPPTSYSELRAEVERAASDLDSRAPGSGDQLRAAYDYFEPRFIKADSGARHPGHWSELSRRKIVKLIQERGRGSRTWGSHMVAIYALLSRATHPGISAETWLVTELEDGGTGVQISGRNQHAPAVAASAAIDIITEAFRALKSNET